MSNGKLLAEYKRKLDCGETIPQNVTNAVVIEALVEIYGMIDDVRNFMNSAQVEKQLDDERDKDKLSARSLWENYGRDVIKLVVAIIIGFLLAKVGLK